MRKADLPTQHDSFAVARRGAAKQAERKGAQRGEPRWQPSSRILKTTDFGGPDRTRTCDLRFRKPLLYPAELRDHVIDRQHFSLLGRRVPSSSAPQNATQSSYFGLLSPALADRNSRVGLHGVAYVAVEVKCRRDRAGQIRSGAIFSAPHAPIIGSRRCPANHETAGAVGPSRSR
jgi:hypothetical protein